MEFTIKSGSPEKQRAGCVVVGVYEGKKLSPSAQSIDKASSKYLADVLRRGDHEGKLGTTLLLQKVRGVTAERVLLVGLGREREFGENQYTKALTAAIRALRVTGAADATVCLTELHMKRRETGWKYGEYASPLAEGDIDFSRVLKLFRGAGYDGSLTIENEALGRLAPAEKRAALISDASHLKTLVGQR